MATKFGRLVALVCWTAWTVSCALEGEESDDSQGHFGAVTASGMDAGGADGGCDACTGIQVQSDGSGLGIVQGPCQWSTTDYGPIDTACCAGESALADAGGGNVCVIGTHGGPGIIQCMPPPGVYADSGAGQLLCSICYAGAPGPDGGPSVAQCIAQQQAAGCEDVIACTGAVSPRGYDTTRACAVVVCAGGWVNGCNPPASISPSSPGICYDTATRGDDAGPWRD